MLYRDLKISGSQPLKKSSKNSVKDIMTEEHPNNLTANLMKTRGIVRRLKRKRLTDLLN